MRERNEIESPPFIADRENTTDDLVQFLKGEELGYCEFSNGNDQLRSQEIDLIVHPGGAVPNLVRSRYPIASGCGLAGKTAAYRSEVNLGAHLFFTHSAKLLEPTEERSARRPGEGFSEHRLFHTGRLTDEHDVAQDRSAGNWRRQHPRTAATLAQERDVLVELFLLARSARHCRELRLPQRRKKDMIKVRTMLTMMQVTIGK